MVSKLKIGLVVKLKWWLPLYLNALQFFCIIAGRAPDVDKLAKIVAKGIYIKIGRLK